MPALNCVCGHHWETVPDNGATVGDLCPRCGRPGSLTDTLPTIPAVDGPVPETISPFPQSEATGSAALRVPGYEILEELGRGGMGVVYRARQAGLNRVVALKMIRDGLLAGRGELSRFQDEARAIARLRHPNLVQIQETGEVEGKPFFSLELVEGETWRIG